MISLSHTNGQSDRAIYQTIDSLKALSKASKNDTFKLANSTLIARYYRYVNIDSSKLLLREVIQLHKSKKLDLEKHAFAYNVIADIYRLEQNIDSVKYFYEEAFSLFQNEINPNPLLAIAPPYGNFLVKNKEVDKGIAVLQKAIQVAIENEDNHNLSFLYASLGNIIYNVQEDPIHAKSILYKGIESSKEMDEANFKRVNSSLNLGLAKIFLAQNDLDSTTIYAQKALVMSEEVHYFQKALISCNILCRSYLNMEKFAQADYYNKKAFELFSEVRNVEAIINAKILKVAIYRKTKKIDDAISAGNQILNDYANNLKGGQKEELFNHLFDSYTIKGDKSNTIQLKDSLIVYTKHNYDEKHGKLLAKMYDETLVMEQKAKNKILVFQQNESKKRLALKNTIVVILILTLLLTLLWGMGTYRLYQQKNELSQNLEKLVVERTKDLQILNDELIQTNEELRTITYIASHDIKEPMRNIGGFISLINRKLPQEFRESLKEEFLFINNNIKQLYTLIEDITKYINFSKKEAVEIAQVNLENVIERVESELPDYLIDKNSQIKYNDLKPIATNYSALFFVLKNLIDNGLKYNESSQPIVEVFQKETADETQIFVSDNGLGIAEEYHEKIFEMHKRLHNRDKYKGSGLGLSIAKILVEKLNGRIELKSKPFQGSTFIVCLPKVQNVVQEVPFDIEMKEY